MAEHLPDLDALQRRTREYIVTWGAPASPSLVASGLALLSWALYWNGADKAADLVMVYLPLAWAVALRLVERFGRPPPLGIVVEQGARNGRLFWSALLLSVAGLRSWGGFDAHAWFSAGATLLLTFAGRPWSNQEFSLLCLAYLLLAAPARAGTYRAEVHFRYLMMAVVVGMFGVVRLWRRRSRADP